MFSFCETGDKSARYWFSFFCYCFVFAHNVFGHNLSIAVILEIQLISEYIGSTTAYCHDADVHWTKLGVFFEF